MYLSVATSPLLSDAMAAQVEPANHPNLSDPVVEQLIVPGMFWGTARFSHYLTLLKTVHFQYIGVSICEDFGPNKGYPPFRAFLMFFPDLENHFVAILAVFSLESSHHLRSGFC